MTFKIMHVQLEGFFLKKKEKVIMLNTFTYSSHEKYVMNQRIHLLFITLSKMGLAEKIVCYLDTCVLHARGAK